MRRNFLTGLIVCLIPTALAGLFVGRGLVRESAGDVGFRRGIDLAGGTILVYEVNEDRTKALKRAEGDDAAADPGRSSLTNDDIRRLAESLKKRIDPNDLKNVIVRPVGTNRVEIILPFSGSASGEKTGNTEDEIARVKDLVRQVGVLEFRILANPTDDREGIADAERLVNSADTDPAVKAQFESAAKAGLPPPAPDRTFNVTVNGQTVDGTRYEWVELGKEERDTLGLSNAFAGPEPPVDRRGNARSTASYNLLSAQRGKAVSMGDMLVYSREFVKRAPTKDEEDKKIEYFLLTRVSPSDTLRVVPPVALTAAVNQDGLNPAVSFTFNPAGANKFGAMTERNRKSEVFKRYLAIVMDGKIVSAPTLNEPIRDRGQISGDSFDIKGVRRLVEILRSGALNAELKPEPVSENTVGPTLGADTIQKGLRAIALAFAAILLFMVYYYRFTGLVACVALLANLLLTVGFMAAFGAAFTLPGLAGIVLMLGMAVDANVLINERLREELDKGASLPNAIRIGYDRAFLTIIDTHLTSIFTSLVLYMFGNDQLKGFAVSLTVGLAISLFTSLYMTRLVFDYWTHKRWMTRYHARRFFSRPSIDFMRLRYAMFAATAILTVGGLGLFLARGERTLNVDFVGGTVYGGRLKDGQERALNTTPDGKPGFLQLLDEDHQKKRLVVKEVVPISQQAAGEADAAGKVAAGQLYQVVYDDGDGKTSSVVLTLANAPAGATEEERIADLKARLGGLPDVSVEQVYLAGERFDNAKSRQFTVRTTEREKDVVQVILDRLLRDEATGEPLLASTALTGATFNGPVARLTFDRPVLPSYFKEFLSRELTLKFRNPEAKAVGVSSAADQAGAQAEERSGRYDVVEVSVADNPDFRALRPAGGAVAGGAAGADGAGAADAATFKEVVEAAAKAFGARPYPDRLETFDPALAADTRNKALYAILVSWLAILGYLWFRFGNWTFGLAAVLCLVHDLCFTLGAIAACHFLHDTLVGHLLRLQDFKIDLAAVAALLTLVGYSVNEIIVNFARIRENRGKSPVLTAQIINDSVNQTLSRTILTSTTVFLVSFVLYWFGGEGVHLFAFVMATGVVISTFSSIYVASPLLLYLGEGVPKVTQRFPARQPAETTA
jgi:SecD/SecF fusion protein